MGYCTNANGALVPFANDKASCDAVGGTFSEINQVRNAFNREEIEEVPVGQAGFLDRNNIISGIKNLASPDAWISNSAELAETPYVGGLIDVLNPAPEIASMIKNMTDPELRAATVKFIQENPVKAASAGAVSLFAKKFMKLKTAAKLGYAGNVATEALEAEDLPFQESIKAELDRGIFNITGETPEEETTETKTEEEQRIADEKAADDLAKGRGSKEEEEARKSFSDRFKEGMKDPATINKLGMLMDYYGRNLQDRGENPLVAYEKAQATKAAAGKPDTAAFNAVDMSREDLENIFTPKKGWFKFRSEADREKAASNMIGRYRTIQNAAFTRHGVILTHAEIMKLLEDERDQAAARAAATK